MVDCANFKNIPKTFRLLQFNSVIVVKVYVIVGNNNYGRYESYSKDVYTY